MPEVLDPASLLVKFINTKKGLPYFEDSEGNYWNLSLFIEGSKTFEKVENADIAYEGGKLFGDFLNLTEGIDTNEIVDILPNFHEMSFRYHQFYEALENASAERLLLAEKCIQQVNDLKTEMHILQNLKNEGKIPLRITHNDTKISNALLKAYLVDFPLPVEATRFFSNNTLIVLLTVAKATIFSNP